MTDRSRESHVTVPLLQSLITGLMLALLVAVATLGVRRWAGFEYGWVEVALLVAGSFALGFAALWCVMLWALRPERELAAPRVEPMRVDVAKERIIPVFTQRVNPETLKENERQLRFSEFLRACEQSTASRYLFRHFTPAEVEDFRGVLFTLGVADWNGAEPRQGWRLLMTAQEIAARLRIRL